MPVIGMGTYAIEDVDTYFKAIVEVGYRHIDTASFYKNEEVIGEALQKVFKESSVKREDLFVVTKIWGDQKKDVEGALKESLQKLQLDYVDLYLVHWPVAFEVNEEGRGVPIKIPNHKTWADMEALVKAGLTKSIGVSNFGVQTLMDMLAYCEIKPVCNQIELHPYLVQEDLVKYMKDNDIIPVAYSPLFRPGSEQTSKTPPLTEVKLIQDLSTKYEKTPGQIILNWGIQRGHVVIPKSTNLERQRENIRVSDFKIDEDDVESLSALNSETRIFANYDYDFVLHSNIYA